MKMIYSLLFFCISNAIFAQNFNSNIKLSIELQEVDSQHYIVPHLKVFADTQKIEIKKLIYFSLGGCSQESQITIEKLIGNTYVNFSILSLPQEFINNDLNNYQSFTSKDTLDYRLKLGDIIPLEPGKYRVIVKIHYLMNGFPVRVSSDYLFFDILHIPKGSSFFTKLL